MFERSSLALLCALAGPALGQAEQPLSGGGPSAQTDVVIAGDWKVAAQNDQLIVFVKPGSLSTESNGDRRLSVRFEFGVPQTQGSKAYLSMLVLTEFECAQNLTRNIEATAFAAHNLVTPIGPPQKGQGDWLTVVDGSIAGNLKRQACTSSP